MKKVLIWTASIIVVLAIGGAIAANYAVDKVLKSMSGMDISSLEELSQEDLNSSVPDAGAEQGPSDEQTNDDEASINDDPNTNDDPDISVSNDGTTGAVTTTPSSKPSNNSGQSSSSSNGGGTSGNQGSADNKGNGDKDTSKGDSGYTAEVSVDKAKEIEENITLKDKAKVVSTLMGNLSASDIATLQQLASGGLSVEKKKEARSLLLEKLSEDEYNELIAIAAKHGVSQGRQYAEVKDE